MHWLIRCKQHRVEISMRREAGLHKATWHIEQSQILQDLQLACGTGVDWVCFSQEVCEITTLDSSQKIGGEGKIIQTDKSKFGKQKYHRGHYIKGQWVFDWTEQDSRKCLMVAVDKRDKVTFLPLFEWGIEPETVIILCTTAYCNLEKHGYTHRRSLETSKGEGKQRWRQAKVKLPPFGVRKHHFSSYLAELTRRYINSEDDLFKIFSRDVKKLYSVQFKQSLFRFLWYWNQFVVIGTGHVMRSVITGYTTYM